jgi:hypothetical protein
VATSYSAGLLGDSRQAGWDTTLRNSAAARALVGAALREAGG